MDGFGASTGSRQRLWGKEKVVERCGQRDLARKMLYGEPNHYENQSIPAAATTCYDDDYDDALRRLSALEQEPRQVGNVWSCNRAALVLLCLLLPVPCETADFKLLR